jgi:NAD-specific glutamate dehydrogenase
MKEFIKKITGIKKLEEEKERLEQERAEALARAEEAKSQEEDAKRQEELAKLTPKERATELKEPYVAVLDTKVNPENVRNGFFELDWNEYFIVQLKQAGYGFDGDPEEEIVDRWFRDIVKAMLAEEGMDVTRGAGFINVIPIEKGRSEVS